MWYLQGASQGAGAARVSRGAHHLALVTRSQVLAIWRQPRRVRCGNLNVLLLLVHGVRPAQSYFPTVRWRSRRDQCGGQTQSQLPSYSTRGAAGDILTVLAHSDWCRACAGQAARHRHESNAVVLANTRRRSEIVARCKLRDSCATHDASPANSRVWCNRARPAFCSGRGLYPKFLQISNLENGSFEVLSLHLPAMEVVSGVRIVQCHAIIDVVIDVRAMECHASMDVVNGVRVVLRHPLIDIPLF